MIENALKALALLHDFQQVERTIFVPKQDRQENDLEHSYLLAMLAWQLGEILAPDLSREKIIRYALVHDLVEVYAGDVPFYQTQSDAALHKKDREHASLVRILDEKMLSGEIRASLEAYEACSDAEAQFVYALDKVIPIMTIYLDGGRTWKQHGITLEKLSRLKREKVKDSPHILAFFEELVPLLQKHEQELFPPAS